MSFEKLRLKNIEETKQKIRASIKKDILLIQATHSLEELTKSLNQLTEALRKHYELYLPEISKTIQDPQIFIKLISKSKNQLIKEYDIKDTLGIELKEKDLEILKDYINEITTLYRLEDNLTNYIENLTKEIAPNLSKEAQPLLASKLLALAGSLKNLAFMPSSKLQLLGAEKALFRHLKNKKKYKSPKYGIIYNHQLIQTSKEKGKAARHLASKLTIATRKDYFKRWKK